MKISHSLAIGVVSDYEPAIAAAIAAIAPEAYNGTLPVDISFLGDTPEVIEALVGTRIDPVVRARSQSRRR